MNIRFQNGSVLSGTVFEKKDICIDQNIICDAAYDVIDATGYYILPGIIDLHGDGFDRHIQPRANVYFDRKSALRHIDAEMATCGITTAWLASSWSWEGGGRSPERTIEFCRAIDQFQSQAITDLRVQIRLETHTCDRFDQLMDCVKAFGIDYVVFNNHLPEAQGMLQRKDGSFDAWAKEVGRSSAEHLVAVTNAIEMADAVPHFEEQVSCELKKLGVSLGSHDDETRQSRAYYASLGATIAEFPTTILAAEQAKSTCHPVIMGAPNIVRGGSQSGNIAAIDLVRENLCDALVSDYYYPALYQAALKLWQDQEMTLGLAWKLISENPARIMNLSTKGKLDTGYDADLVFLNAETLQIDATLCGGRFGFVRGPMADRLADFSHGQQIVAA